jgi:7-carboxy-7-deazaguanine synthase
MTALCNAGRTVMLETSGACDLSPCDPRVIRIVDFKPPSSGQCERNDIVNIDRLHAHDEVKFVIGDREDYEWSCQFIERHNLAERVAAILFAPVYKTPADRYITGHPGLSPTILASWMLEGTTNVRLQLQIHKSIWDPSARCV